jgi:hypothetical protein
LVGGGFAEVVAPAFFRREPRVRARCYLLGPFRGLERKNGWSLAEFAGVDPGDLKKVFPRLKDML